MFANDGHIDRTGRRGLRGCGVMLCASNRRRIKRTLKRCAVVWVQVFAEIQAAVSDTAILATNTSTIDINVAAGSVEDQSRGTWAGVVATRGPAPLTAYHNPHVSSHPSPRFCFCAYTAVVGTHYFSPAHIMPLLEVVVSDKTAPQVAADVLGLARASRKVCGVCAPRSVRVRVHPVVIYPHTPLPFQVPVFAGNCAGFVVNRMFAPYGQTAGHLGARACVWV